MAGLVRHPHILGYKFICPHNISSVGPYVVVDLAIITSNSSLVDNICLCALSKHIWKLKEERKGFNVSWRFVDRGPTYNPISKVCRLCVKESYYLIFHRDNSTLNKRNEVFNVCRHRNSDLLMTS